MHSAFRASVLVLIQCIRFLIGEDRIVLRDAGWWGSVHYGRLVTEMADQTTSGTPEMRANRG
jgi:hypothetical protein